MAILPLQLAGSLSPSIVFGAGTNGFGGGISLANLQGFRKRKSSAERRKIQPSADSQLHASRSVGSNSDCAEPEQLVDSRTDESLLAAYLDGERAAFPKLMSRYSDELLHFLTRFLGSRPAADDVFQETFLQIHLSAETFDPERRFKPWLFTIAANKARDYHRKHNRWSAMSLSASIDQSGDGERFVDLLQANVDKPDVPLLDAERSRLVKGVIDSLPAHLREILLLSYFQRLSYNQISDSLEIPLGTVKSRLHTAVASFARAWNLARGNDENPHQDARGNEQFRGVEKPMQDGRKP
jgi:RNA polymerase sigma-70 factor (ECF subfamily)